MNYVIYIHIQHVPVGSLECGAVVIRIVYKTRSANGYDSVLIFRSMSSWGEESQSVLYTHTTISQAAIEERVS